MSEQQELFERNSEDAAEPSRTGQLVPWLCQHLIHCTQTTDLGPYVRTFWLRGGNATVRAEDGGMNCQACCNTKWSDTPKQLSEPCTGIG